MNRFRLVHIPKDGVCILSANTSRCWLSEYIDINPTSAEILYFARSLSNHIVAIIPIDADIKVEMYRELESSYFQCPFCTKSFFPATKLKQHVSFCCSPNSDDRKPFVSKIQIPLSQSIAISDDSEDEIKRNLVFPSLGNIASSNEQPVILEISDDSEDGVNRRQYTAEQYDDKVGRHSADDRYSAVKQVKYTRGLWANTVCKKVPKIPLDIDGIVLYNVKADNRNSLLASCRDGRTWKNDSRTAWSGYVSVRYRDCAGSIICKNNDCLYLQHFTRKNPFYFDKNGNCRYCADSGEKIECMARKYTAFISETEADVYHYGQHSCLAKSNHNHLLSLAELLRSTWY